MRKMFFARNNNQIANEQLEALLEAIQSKNAQAVKELFSDNAWAESGNMEKSILVLFDYFQGELVSYKSWAGPSVHATKNHGEYWKSYDCTYDFETTQDKYRHATEIINVSEALQEKKIAHIAEEIASRPEVKMVLIAGPSSSGKTTTCKRLSIQLVCNGIRPVPISLDDYFVDRELTPLDANGAYDYESLHALNLELLNRQLAQLFRGEEVELPRYDFITGKSKPSGQKMKMREGDILVVEGIHALNPELTAQIPDALKYRVYASALTTILLDEHNYIPTTDNRLLRRIIRDDKQRGCSARDTISRWQSVRNGENKWIFPYQENADAMFNTAMIYELAAIKTQVEPLLERVPENCEEYAEAYRLRKFLSYFNAIPNRQIPATSLLREFLGGSSFKY